ncbi:MAG: peptidase M48, partial [Pseudomonadota bacterium]
MRWFVTLVSLVALAGCDVPSGGSGTATGSGFSPEVAARNFVSVVQRVEPVAERECRARTRR